MGSRGAGWDAPRQFPAGLRLAARALVFVIAVAHVLVLLLTHGGVGLPLAGPVVSGLDLVIHEVGHGLMFPTNHELLIFLGGSFWQVVVPLLCWATFRVQGRPLWAAVSLLWCAECLLSVSIYASDAPSRALPLLFDDPDGHAGGTSW